MARFFPLSVHLSPLKRLKNNRKTGLRMPTPSVRIFWGHLYASVSQRSHLIYGIIILVCRCFSTPSFQPFSYCTSSLVRSEHQPPEWATVIAGYFGKWKCYHIIPYHTTQTKCYSKRQIWRILGMISRPWNFIRLSLHELLLKQPMEPLPLSNY